MSFRTWSKERERERERESSRASLWVHACTGTRCNSLVHGIAEKRHTRLAANEARNKTALELVHTRGKVLQPACAIRLSCLELMPLIWPSNCLALSRCCMARLFSIAPPFLWNACQGEGAHAHAKVKPERTACFHLGQCPLCTRDKACLSHEQVHPQGRPCMFQQEQTHLQPPAASRFLLSF